MTRMIQRLWADEEGATLVEYGFILMLIAAVCVAAVVLIGQGALGLFTAMPAGL